MRGRIQVGADADITIFDPKTVRDNSTMKQGAPAENWLPITREDLDLDVILCVYRPALEKMKTWKAPKAVRLK